MSKCSHDIDIEDYCHECHMKELDNAEAEMYDKQCQEYHEKKEN